MVGFGLRCREGHLYLVSRVLSIHLVDGYMTDCGGRKAYMTLHIVPRGILLGKYWEYAVKEFVGEMTIY